MHYKLMGLNIAICSVLSLSSWWQEPLGKSYGFGAKMKQWSVTLLPLEEPRDVDMFS